MHNGSGNDTALTARNTGSDSPEWWLSHAGHPAPERRNIQTRNANISPGLKIDGTTATCSVLVVGNAENDEITVVVKLWKGSSCIATWNESGIGYVNFLENKTVSKGAEYTLTAEVIINGIRQPTYSING